MFVFVCWTPYQIFNAINFVMNDVEHSKGNADIYIYHEFGGAAPISSKLREMNVFCHVYDVDCYDPKRVWYSKFNKLKRLLCPYATIKKYLRSDIDVRKQGYETLVISGNNLFSVNLYNAISGMKVYFIDDGIGSYFGDMRAQDMTLIYRLGNKLLKRGPLSYDIRKIYVNNKTICKTTISDCIEQLPALHSDSPVIQMLEKVFEYKDNTNYSTHKIIYLSQPYVEVEEYIAGAEMRVLEEVMLSVYSKNEILLRLHPRQNMEEFPGWNLDIHRNLWELECVRQIRDESVLVGGFSTSQFMSKILVNKEPYVIFLYKLFYPSEYTEQFDSVIESFRNLYACPERIQVPDTVDELKILLNRIHENVSEGDKQ